MKSGLVVFILSNFKPLKQINQLASTLLSHGVHDVGIKVSWINEIQKSEVFSRKLQFESIWADLNQPGLEAVWEYGAVQLTMCWIILGVLFFIRIAKK